jgi:glycosyltransferase involved in cell wall biosynthesis
MNDYAPKVTIITPVYNGAMYIEDLIISVRQQSYNNIEHIIINDGSDDGGATTEILRKHTHLRWWERENRGQYATMNEGLESATGEWVCFVSADDLVGHDAVSTIVEIASQNPGVDGIFGRSSHINADGSVYSVQPILIQAIAFYKYLAQIPHCSLYMRRSYLLQNNLWFDENLRFNGDYDWFLNILKNRPKLFYVPQTLSLIRKHDAQLSSSKVDEILEERASVIKKHEINLLTYRGLNFLFTLRHAMLRIIYLIRFDGFRAGLDLIWYFVRHKLGLI